MRAEHPKYLPIMTLALALSFPVTVVVTVTGISTMPVLRDDGLRML